MAKWTTRDRIWNVALKKDEEFDASELSEILDHSERTVRDTLNCIAECGAIEKVGGHGQEPVSYRSLVDVEE